MEDDDVKRGIRGREDLDYMGFGPKAWGVLRSAYLYLAKCMHFRSCDFSGFGVLEHFSMF